MTPVPIVRVTGVENLLPDGDILHAERSNRPLAAAGATAPGRRWPQVLHSLFAGLALLATALLGLLADVHAAAGQEPSGEQATPPAASTGEVNETGVRDLYLEVFINGKSTNLIGHFVELPDGELVVEPDELTEVGIKPMDTAINEDGFVVLSRLSALTYRMDETSQRLDFETGADGRATHVLDLKDDEPDKRPGAASSFGSVVNYSLFAATNNLQEADETGILSGVSGNFDARVFSPYGVLENSFVASYTDGPMRGLTRGATTWSYADTKRAVSYRAGDIVSGGLSWTRPVYLGGVQVERNFGLRPDLVTLPMPSFKGSAAVPSTIQVFTQNAMTYSGSLDEGPFEINNMPVYAGAGEARVILTDSLGRETEASLPFFISSEMLAKGLWDFSAEVGFPKRDTGLESFNYDGDIYGVASARYGLSNRLTLEGHTEIGQNLLNGGLGATFPLFQFGSMSLAGAGSYSDGEVGTLASASIELAYRDWNVMGRVQRTFGSYKDIASLTATSQSETYGTEQVFDSPDTPRTVIQAALGIPSPIDFSSLSLAYTQIETDDGEDSRIVSLSSTHQLMGKYSLYASAFVDLDQDDQFGVYAGVSFPLGQDMNSEFYMESGSDNTDVGAEVSKSEKNEIGSYGWRIRAVQGESEVREATGSYRTRWGRAEAGIDQGDGQMRATAEFDGAVAMVGSDVFASGRIDDAFAAIDVGAPGVEVFHQNRLVGKSDYRGKMLVPDMVSNEKNTIAINPDGLPIDAQISATKTIVVPAWKSGVHVDFGVAENVGAAIVTLVDEEGSPLEVGLGGQLEGGDDFIIGYDGQAYLSGLHETNRVTVRTGYEQSCTATFGFTPSKDEQSAIENVVCR
ncbi:MAG: fimbria/pilus outer membrane usher protein [Rhizobiaceae bacterium]|nr:fimbria/pilus outer membrane usher protein [Rhizobiaceae bacterium]